LTGFGRAVSRWDNEREPIGGIADRLLRLMVATRAPAGEQAQTDWGAFGKIPVGQALAPLARDQIPASK
jgi:hypothetical protein